nr:MAG TPA: hypothetical protein [Caudoviricetes sp.]
MFCSSLTTYNIPSGFTAGGSVSLTNDIEQALMGSILYDSV